jgi:hypothetical protein
MPQRKKEIRKKVMSKNIFVLSILFILLLLVLASFLTTKYFAAKPLSLYCLKADSLIECRWTNCQFETGESELIIAKSPNYVDIVAITKEAGSAMFTYNLTGKYAALLYCKNGEITQEINIS